MELRNAHDTILRLREEVLFYKTRCADLKYQRRQLKAAFEAAIDIAGERQTEIDAMKKLVGDTAREAYDCARYVIDGGWGRELWLCCALISLQSRLDATLHWLDTHTQGHDLPFYRPPGWSNQEVL